MMKRLLLAVVVCAWVTVPEAQGPSTIPLQLTEMGGIRRTQFPTTALIPLKPGELRDPANVKLMLEQTEVPVQVAVEGRHPDGSLSGISIDFNASPGASQTLNYMLQFGAGVTSAATMPRGLTVAETADGFQVGNIRFNKSGSPLIASVKYRDEAIASGANGLTVVAANGQSFGFFNAKDVKVAVVKPGPLVVALRYTGELTVGSATLPMSLVVEMPSSKSWVKLTAAVTDRSRQLRAIVLSTPLALGTEPWEWDFGTSSWVYGTVRNQVEGVTMNAIVRSQTDQEWTVIAGPRGREQTIETSKLAPATAGSRDKGPFAGWGHVQGTKEVVAFAMTGTNRPGTHRASFDGTGQLSMRFEPAQQADVLTLTVYEHFVSTPVQIGAATSPAAILSPLSVGVMR